MVPSWYLCLLGENSRQKAHWCAEVQGDPAFLSFVSSHLWGRDAGGTKTKRRLALPLRSSQTGNGDKHTGLEAVGAVG